MRRFDDFDIPDHSAFSMCGRKKKYKSKEASKIADRFDQRKYECPVCGHWHLTKARKYDETPRKK